MTRASRVLALCAALFVLNAVLPDSTATACEVMVGITSPADPHADPHWCARLLSVTGWGAIPAFVGAMVGYLVIVQVQTRQAEPLEAMDAGLAVAGPERGGVPHYIRDGVNGFLLPTGSGERLAAVLASVCATPQTEPDAVAGRGRRTVRSGYSVHAMAEAPADDYRRSSGD